MCEVKRVKLSYREDPVGGEVRDQPEISGDVSALKEAKHLVLLIHGYNNDTKAAEKAYEGFHARQRDLDKDKRYGIGRTFVEVYWPGDAAWGIVSFLFYMGSIKHAIQTAERLAGYLEKNAANAIRIDIVAHSMGCRLASELLRALAIKAVAPSIERIVYMAAAVPTFMLEQRNPARRLRPSYNQVLRDGTRSLYSGSDMVLALAFPAGQSLAPGEEGLLPAALGHKQWIDATVPHNLDQRPNNGAGHGDYWGWNTDPRNLARAEYAAKEVHDYLQFPSAGSRTCNERPQVEINPLEARTYEAKREITGRAIAMYV